MTRDLVLLHGWGMSHRVWEPVVPALSRRFRVHNLDLPGYGDRSGPQETGASGSAILDRWSDDVAAQAPSGAIWMGWSLGALVVLNAILRGAGAIEAAVLVAATPRFIRDDDWDAGMAPETLAEFVEGLGVNVSKVLKRFLMLQAGGGEDPRRVGRGMSQYLVDDTTNPATLEDGLRVFQQVDLRPGIDRLAAPVLVVHGDGDRIVPSEAGGVIAERAPRASLVKLDAGHAPFFTRPQAFTEAVLAWT